MLLLVSFFFWKLGTDISQILLSPFGTKVLAVILLALFGIVIVVK